MTIEDMDLSDTRSYEQAQQILTAAFSDTSVLTTLNLETGTILVSRDGEGSIVAVATYHFDTTTATTTLDLLGVKPESQKQGHGKKLVQRFLKISNDHHRKAVAKVVNPDLIDWYRKLGMEFKGSEAGSLHVLESE